MSLGISLGMTLRDIGDSIRSQPSRFALSFLAIAVGIVSLVLLLAVLSALNAKSERLVRDLGVDVVGVLRLAPINETVGLHRRHATLTERNFDGLIASTMRRYTAPTLGTHQQLTVVATDHKLASLRGWPVTAGRFLDRRDIRDRARNTVVSRALSEEWGWKVGHVIYLGGTPFRVIGIVNAGGSALDTEEGDPRLVLGDRVVMVPRSVPVYWEHEQAATRGAVDAMFVRALDVHVDALRHLLTQPDQKAGELAWVTPASLLRNINLLKNNIALVAGAISVLCLLLGGTALMTLMVANVRDRVAEIGLRQALGATRADITTLFMLEAVIVTASAGLLGTGLAYGALTAGSWPIPVKPDAWTAVLPPLAAAGLGALFSYWPARAAARIVPAEALRNE